MDGCFHAVDTEIHKTIILDNNHSFAFGINRAIQEHNRLDPPDYVLVLNNDLQFPNKEWLKHLLSEAGPNHITVPTTDRTARHRRAAYESKPSYWSHEASAYCWLVPFEWCQYLKKTYGFWMFDEDFKPAYGEDDWTGLLLNQRFGERIFRIVPRAWIKHLKAQSASVQPHDKRKTNAILKAKVLSLMKRRDLNPVLRRRLQGYSRMLKC